MKMHTEGLPYLMSLDEVAETGGVADGGAFVSFACATCMGYSDFSALEARNIEFGGVSDYVRPSKAGTLRHGDYDGTPGKTSEPIAPGDFRPDQGTAGAKNRKTRDVMIDAERRVQGESAVLSAKQRKQILDDAADVPKR